MSCGPDNQPRVTPVTNCADCLPPVLPCTGGEPCEEVFPGACVAYNGPDLPGLGVITRDRYDAILQKLNLNRDTLAVATAGSDAIGLTGNGLGTSPLTAQLILDPDPHNLTVVTDAGVATKVSAYMVQDVLTLIESDPNLHTLFCTLLTTCTSGYCGKAADMTVTYISGALAVNWTPYADNTTAQEVQYKKLSAAAWTSYATVTAATSSDNIAGVAPNTVYMVRVETDCYIGGPTFNAPVTISTTICPTVSTVVTYDTVAYSFNYVANDFSTVIVSLQKASDGSPVASDTHDLAANPATYIGGSFTALASLTAYRLTVTLKTPLGDAYTVDCTPLDITTISAPFCNIPNTVSTTMA